MRAANPRTPRSGAAVRAARPEEVDELLAPLLPFEPLPLPLPDPDPDPPDALALALALPEAVVLLACWGPCFDDGVTFAAFTKFAQATYAVHMSV